MPGNWHESGAMDGEARRDSDMEVRVEGGVPIPWHVETAGVEPASYGAKHLLLRV